MALALEAIGALFANIGLFGGGLGFAFLSILLAATRSATGNKDHWAIMFGALSWVFALIIPGYIEAGFIFAMGTLGIILSTQPLLEKMGDKNIYVMAIICGILNLLILAGTTSFEAANLWENDYEASYTIIYNAFNGNLANLDAAIPTYTLCQPNEQDENGEPCQSDLISGIFDPNLYVPFASILTLGTWIGKIIAFFGLTALAPVVMNTKLLTTSITVNPFVGFLMASVVTLWELAIFYKLVLFMLDKRAARN